ncbi:MAG: hypothetical protein AAF840_06190 [Bacteroidota bacterium]
MKRLELFEFEDFSWLPKVVRTGVTNLLQVLHQVFKTSEVLVQLLSECQEKVPFSQIVDLGSGSGGPMIDVVNTLNSQRPTEEQLQLTLTDLHPDPVTIAKVRALGNPQIKYAEASVNAVAMDQVPTGLKTMIASFHHMPPPVAQQILQEAEHNRQPILIYEFAENNVPVVVWTLLLPISLLMLVFMSLLLTFRVRPLTFSQIIFTYLIPIIPLIYAWDGQASIMRTYTFDDLRGLIGEQKNENYTWEIASAKRPNGKKAGYYIFGYPTTS